jgi:hypothetical protein
MTERIDIAKARQMFEETTKGEWEVVESEGKTYVAVTGGRIEGYGFTEIAQISEEVDGDGSGDADAYFIAHAHNTFAALLADNARLQSELAEARERAEAAEGCIAKIGKVYSRLVPFVGHEEYDRGWNAAVDEVRGHIRQWRGPQGREGAGNEEH